MDRKDTLVRAVTTCIIWAPTCHLSLPWDIWTTGSWAHILEEKLGDYSHQSRTGEQSASSSHRGTGRALVTCSNDPVVDACLGVLPAPTLPTSLPRFTGSPQLGTCMGSLLLNSLLCMV